MPDKVKNPVGRPRLLKSSEEMWNLFTDYVDHARLHPVIKRELNQRTGEVIEIPIDRPLTIEGFFTFAWDRLGDINGYFYNVNNEYSDFLTITSRIKQCIREQQISGGMGGVYNANLTARLNGLTDKVQNEITTPGKLEIKFEKE